MVFLLVLLVYRKLFKLYDMETQEVVKTQKKKTKKPAELEFQSSVPQGLEIPGKNHNSHQTFNFENHDSSSSKPQHTNFNVEDSTDTDSTPCSREPENWGWGISQTTFFCINYPNSSCFSKIFFTISLLVLTVSIVCNSITVLYFPWYGSFIKSTNITNVTDQAIKEKYMTAILDQAYAGLYFHADHHGYISVFDSKRTCRWYRVVLREYREITENGRKWKKIEIYLFRPKKT